MIFYCFWKEGQDDDFILPCVKGSPKVRCLKATSSVMRIDKRNPV